MKYVERHPFADADAAAQKLVEIADGVEAVQHGRIYIERVNEPFLAAGGNMGDIHCLARLASLHLEAATRP